MAYYYKIEQPPLPSNGIQVYETNAKELARNHSASYDFSKHVLIELLDDVTPEAKLWENLGLDSDKTILHKRLMIDSHRVHCRRAVVVCSNANDAKKLAQRVSQTKVMKRCICATVVQDLLFDFKLFEKQIARLGDRRPQHQLLYVTDLNRSREPAVLAQFLKELFSPFGNVLSVFVSEDKDGFAHPEGVIKFARLSEAFAAEIAYDQFIVGMERLSVTTHHNILLSQCDLRVRLREAQRRHIETLNNSLKSEDTSEVDSPKSGSDKNRLHSTLINSPPPFSDGNISHSTELEDVLKNPCKTNLIDCLKSMALCSDSSVTRDTISDGLSTHDGCEQIQNSKSHDTVSDVIEPSMVTLPLKQQDWSSRISNWIAEIPNNVNNSSASLKDTLPLGNKTANCKAMDDASSVCSFITCNNNTQICTEDPLYSPSSCKSHGSRTSSVSDGNRTITMLASSPDSFYTAKDNCIDQSKADTDMSFTCVLSRNSASNSTVDMSLTQVLSQSSVSNSISAKRNYSCSQKLSLKNQKLNSSLMSNSQQSFVLNENIIRGKSAFKLRKFPVVRLQKLTPEEIQNLCSPKSANGFLKPSKQKGSNCDIFSISSLSSDKENESTSISTRRSSRLSSRKASSHSSFSGKNQSQLELASRSTQVSKSDSPLRAWLKRDLSMSSNVNVFDSVENTRKIICATSNRNVLAHVGCSHMTCDVCYPGSTNLLLGCH